MSTKDFRSSPEVAIEQIAPKYPQERPFHPDTRYPEYEGPVGTEPNAVYAGVRQLFTGLGLDAAHAGTAEWNPLGDLIRPGDKVIIKPNNVLHKNYSGDTVEAVITHGSVIRAVAEYVLKALRGTGQLVIGDAPVQHCDFDVATAASGLAAVHEYLRTLRPDTALRDLRLVTSSHSRMGVRELVSGDPAGYAYVDLAAASEHSTSNEYSRFRVTNYDPSFMQRHHNDQKHEYIVSRSVLDSDVVISMSKLKTHRKAGISVTLKNLVGINGHKDCLPHHKTGSHYEGGDEYLEKNWVKRMVTRIQEVEDVQTSSLPRLLAKIPKRLLLELARRMSGDKHFEGSWWGNDTIWRTVVDLNRILFFWNIDQAAVAAEPQRRFLSIVDGVIAGEEEGPLDPTAKHVGLLLGGHNPAAVDVVAARLMDFDYRKMPSLVNGMRAFAKFAANDIECVSSAERLRGKLVADEKADFFAFRPSAGWRGHIELGDRKAAPPSAFARRHTIGG